MTHTLVVVLQSVAATASLAIGLKFLRFWRQVGDSLFALFAVSFWLLSLSWYLLAIFSPTEENRPYVYLIRLVAFVLIITAVVGKNRQARS